MNGISFYALLLFLAAIALLGIGGTIYYFRPRTERTFRQAPGSRIALAVGDRFTPSDRFAGFIHQESGASIVFIDLPPSAFDRLQSLGDAEKTFAAQGVAGVTQQPLPNREGEYLYLQGTQNTALVDYAKYILVFRESGMAAMVTANIPRVALTSGVITGAEIEEILSSATVHPDAPEGPKLFTLGYLGPFEEDLSLLGTTKGYRLKSSEIRDPANGLPPLFLVAPSLTQAPIPDLTLFAERSFAGIDQVRDKRLEKTQTLEVAGLSAVEAFGSGTDISTGFETLVYQLIVEARHGGYFRIVGLAPASQRERFLSEFSQMAASFRPALTI